jgi:hypothetical protein
MKSSIVKSVQRLQSGEHDGPVSQGALDKPESNPARVPLSPTG